MNENQTIYSLYSGRWERGTLVSRGPKNYKVQEHSYSGQPSLRYVAPDNCAVPGESVCIVWERWRGTNGRGGYRVERERYPEYRVPAEQVGELWREGYVQESAQGVLDEGWLRNYNRNKLTIRFDNYSDLEDPLKDKIRQAVTASQWLGIEQWAKEIYRAELLVYQFGDEEDFSNISFESAEDMARFKLDFGVKE
jgi:hypothetical protein